MAGPPFVVDSSHPAGSDLVSLFPVNEQANRANLASWLSFLSNPTTGLLLDTAFVPGQIFPAGSTTFLTFYQQTAPTGWVKQTTTNDAALRIVTGSTGGTATSGLNFSTVMSASYATAGTALTTSQLPAHTHAVVGNTGNESAHHTHGPGSYGGTTSVAGSHQHAIVTQLSNVISGGDNPGTIFGGGGSTLTDIQGAHSHTFNVTGASDTNSVDHTHAINLNTDNGPGTGATHSHTVALNITYMDVIIATRT